MIVFQLKSNMNIKDIHNAAWRQNFADITDEELIGKTVILQKGPSYSDLKYHISTISEVSIQGFRIKGFKKLLFDFLGEQRYPFETTMEEVSQVYIVSEEEAERVRQQFILKKK